MTSTSSMRAHGVHTYLARHRVRMRLPCTNRAPSSPPKTPRRMKKGICATVYTGLPCSVKEPKVASPGCDRSPNCPRTMPLMSTLSVNEQVIEAANVRHVNAWFQKDDPSSREKRTPPTGAPKAAATPAAAPPDTKSRFSWSLRNGANALACLPDTPTALTVDDRPCDRPAATMPPAWMSGPSLPAVRPDDTEKRTPTDLHNSVLNRTTRGTLTPFRYALISGMPEPAASGSTKATRYAAMAARRRLMAE
mmetsp:Transcript_3433/g.11255  ORF Transcript_3433/g.11255 Transcript_3433/m.11255 type:complete len:250 (+) Transcript_3433:1251-2000(+)